MSGYGSGDGYTVDVRALETHGRDVEVVAGKVGEAAVAGSRLGPDSYGLIGQLWGADVIGAAQEGSRVITTLARAGERTARNLHGAAKDYRDAEQYVARSFRGYR